MYIEIIKICIPKYLKCGFWNNKYMDFGIVEIWILKLVEIWILK